MMGTQEKEKCEACQGEFDTLAEVFSHECSGTRSGREILSRDRSPMATGPCATEKQVAFLVRLGVAQVDAEVMSKSTASETIDRLLKDQGPPPVSEKQERFLRSLLAEREHDLGNDPDAVLDTLNSLPKPSAGASDLIDILLKAPKARTQDELEDGIYYRDGDVFKVYHTVHGSGQQVAKKLDKDTGKFEYEGKKGLRGLTPEHRMTLKQAKEFGAVYGMCCSCGATLTDERSIEAGIGPICARKFT